MYSTFQTARIIDDDQISALPGTSCHIIFIVEFTCGCHGLCRPTHLLCTASLVSVVQSSEIPSFKYYRAENGILQIITCMS